MEFAVLVAVFQFQGRGLHGADAAHEVLVHRVGAVGKGLIVTALIGHIVGVGGQEDEVIGLAHVHGVDDAAAQLLPGVPVLEGRLADGLQQAVLVAAGHLSGGEFDVDEIPAQGAGQGLFQ